MNQYTLSAHLRHARWQQTTFAIPESIYQAWHAQYNSAKQRGIPFEFTLLAWHTWWKRELAKLGPGARRGLRKGEYMMCRCGDSGPYAEGNVYAGTGVHNQADITRDRSATLKRWYATHEAAMKGRTGARHPRSKPVVTPLGRFESGNLAAQAHGMSRAGVFYNIKNGVAGWRYA